jgi:hypothetical protein
MRVVFLLGSGIFQEPRSRWPARVNGPTGQQQPGGPVSEPLGRGQGRVNARANRRRQPRCGWWRD